MPTTYTHDLFGRKIYQQMPREVRRIIREHGDLYRIGLHGPDILFYYMISKNPVSQFGVKMHHEDAAGFFERGMKVARETHDTELLAYLLGFGCHYLLDSEAHPFVNEMHRNKVATHTALEKEFDRMLMEETGRNPYRYRPSDAVVAKYHYAEVIHRAIPEVKTFNIFVSLRMMKFLTNRMVCNDGGRKRRIVEGVLSSLPIKEGKDLSQHFMAKHPEKGTLVPAIKLRRIFEQMVEETPEQLQELYELYTHNQKLGERWHRTYNG